MECIVLTQKEKDKLVTHAIEQQPSESCAMLLGKKVGDNWNVKEVFLTQNIDNSANKFYNFSRGTIKRISTCRKNAFRISWRVSLSS